MSNFDFDLSDIRIYIDFFFFLPFSSSLSLRMSALSNVHFVYLTMAQVNNDD
jgi:hypothetical protein